MQFVMIALLALTGFALAVLFWRWRAQRRERMLARLLDAADELERLLLRARERMQSMRAVVDRVPDDIGAVARASLDARTPVQQGLRDVLEHRLWIARHGADASHAELRQALDALARAKNAIADQLERLESAGADLAEATEAALEQAAREPPTLRRGGDAA